MTPLTERITKLEKEIKELQYKYDQHIVGDCKCSPLDMAKCNQIRKQLYDNLNIFRSMVMLLQKIISDLKKEWKTLEIELKKCDCYNFHLIEPNTQRGYCHFCKEQQAQQSLLQSITGLSREEMLKE